MTPQSLRERLLLRKAHLFFQNRYAIVLTTDAQAEANRSHFRSNNDTYHSVQLPHRIN